MVIYFGADHRGFNLKEILKNFLKEQGYEVLDLGNDHYDETDDYPDFAAKVANKVSWDPESSRGVVICGSGAGVDVTANKFPRVRATLGLIPDQVYDARHDDDVNVLSIAARFTSEEEAKKMVRVFVETPFGDEEKYRRRLEKISAVEIENGLNEFS